MNGFHRMNIGTIVRYAGHNIDIVAVTTSLVEADLQWHCDTFNMTVLYSIVGSYSIGTDTVGFSDLCDSLEVIE